jgi:hypothetical protein
MAMDGMAFARADRDGILARVATDLTAVAFRYFDGIVPAGAGHRDLVVFYSQNIRNRCTFQCTFVFRTGFGSHDVTPFSYDEKNLKSKRYTFPL